MPFVEIENLSFQYALSSAPALSNVSLTVEKGEFLLLFGASGCGKTTLLRHLKQELLPEGKRSGRVLFEGRPVGSLSKLESACGAGLVMQNPDSQIVTGEVWHELAFGLENLGFENGAIRRRVAEMASFFGIGSWFHKKTDELSGGQKQMLNLASILVMQPRLLLLDEPTAMLDPVSAREFTEMIARVNRELGVTVIMAGHRLEEVFHLATRAALLEKGQLICCEAPRGYGHFLKENPRYLAFMPAAAQIFAGCGLDLTRQCPVTVNEGKRLLAEIAPVKSPVKPAERKPAMVRSEKKPTLSASGLRFRYGKKSSEILRGLSMEAFSGQITCILGENGAGKSTLLNLLGGLLQPSEGRVLLDGKELRRYGKDLYRRNIAYLPQNPKGIFVCDSLLEDLRTALRAAGSPDHSEALSIAKEFGLSNLLDRHPYDLSGGEMRRAAIAKLMLTHPRVLLLDEPTAGLDAESQSALALLLRRLCAAGALIVMITHDLDFAARYADRCLLLFDGTALSAGTPREFFGGNFFYTTAANRIARDYDPLAVTCGDVIGLCKGE